MQKVRVAAAVACVAIGSFVVGPAWAAEWRLVEASGTVRVATPGGDPAPAVVNQVLATGATVTTAAGGRAAVFNGAQRITLAPNSRMTLAPDSASGMTRVIEDIGSILFQVDKKAAPHFSVETPLLAAIVKGTTFTVSVDTQGASVHVAEGLVEVRANSSAAHRDIASGQTGLVSREAPGQIGLVAPAAAPGNAAPLGAPPLDYKAVSKGLVDGPEALGLGGTGARTAQTWAPESAAGSAVQPASGMAAPRRPTLAGGADRSEASSPGVVTGPGGGAIGGASMGDGGGAAGPSIESAATRPTDRPGRGIGGGPGGPRPGLGGPGPSAAGAAHSAGVAGRAQMGLTRGADQQPDGGPPGLGNGHGGRAP